MIFGTVSAQGQDTDQHQHDQVLFVHAGRGVPHVWNQKEKWKINR